MKNQRLLICVPLLVSLVACSPSTPQPVAPPPTPQPTPAAKVGSVLPRWSSIESAIGPGIEVYFIAAGDVVDIMVFGHSDMRKEMPVRPDGKIAFRLIGDIQAEGLTIEDFRMSIEKGLTEYMRYPKVDVILKKAKEARFTILGKVVRPGVYPIKGPTTLLDAVAEAQGLSSGQYEGSTIEIADLTNSFLVRRGKVVPVDFNLAVHRGDTSHNVFVEDNDYIYIPSSLAQEVFVLGEVNDPRAYGFRGRVTLLEAAAESGGFKTTARLRDVRVLRGLRSGERVLIEVDVTDIINGRAPDMDLEVGDVVYVPRSRLANAADAVRDILSLMLVYQSSTAIINSGK